MAASKKDSISASEYVEKMRYGGVRSNYDDLSEDSSVLMSQGSKALATKVKKLGPAATFLTLIKGFVCTGCLYLPKSFINGGWTFQIVMLVISCLITLYCAELLL